MLWTGLVGTAKSRGRRTARRHLRVTGGAFLPTQGNSTQRNMHQAIIEMPITEASAAIQALEITTIDHATNEEFQLAKTSFYKDRRSSGGPDPALPSSRLDLVDFLAVAQWRNVDYLPMTWLSSLDSDPGLLGGTANVQQALVDLQHSLACKRIHRENFMAQDAETALRLLITEVAVLGHPIIRQHTNIARLEGVCWDFQSGEIYPVLVFKKAVHGDLRRFMRTAAGREMPFDARLRMCTDVAAAIMTLHAFPDIIHGDIKPENVLIFEDSPSVYSAKVTDFGYSTLNIARQEDELIALPMSWPWTAPEVSKEDFLLSFFEARRADYFSFGMLCLWLLFTDDLSSDLGGDDDLKKLAKLKNEEGLQSFALNLASKTTGTSDKHSQELREGLAFFFKWTLETDPFLRGFSTAQWAKANVAFWKNEREKDRSDGSLDQLLVTSMGISYEDISGIKQPFGYLHYYNTKHMDLGYNIDDVRFNLTQSIGQIAASDFRLWENIRSCLERAASDDSKAAFSLALLFAIGFGIPSDGDQAVHAAKWLLKSGKTQEELNAEVDNIRRIDKISYRSTDIEHDVIDHVSEYRHARILEKAERVYETTLRSVEGVLGTCHPIFRRISITLASLWIEQGLHDKAETLLPRLTADWLASLDTISQDAIVIQHHLATLHINQGRFEEGIALQRTVFEKCTTAFGQEYKSTLAAMGNLATTYWNLGQWDRAEELQVKDLAINRKIRGTDHPRTLAAASNLASTYERQGRLKEAAQLKQELLEISTRIHGEEHSTTVVIMGNLANNYRIQRLWNDSEKLEAKVLGVRKHLYGEGHPDTLKSMANLSSTYFLQGRFKEAFDLEEPIAKAMTARLGTHHPDTLTAWNNLAHTLWAVGRREEAVGTMAEAARLRAEVLGPDHVETKRSAGNLSRWIAEI